MKKAYLLIATILSLLLVNVVKAEEGPFILDFETEIESNRAVLNAGYKDGYITIDYLKNEPSSLIRLYDSKGEIKKEKVIEGKIIKHMAIKDNDIYVVANDYIEKKSKVILLDEKLTITESMGIDGKVIYSKLFSSAGESQIRVVEDEVYLFLEGNESNGIVGILPRDLSDIEYKEVKTYSQMKRYFPIVEVSRLLEDNYPYDPNSRLVFGYKEGKAAVLYANASNCKPFARQQTSGRVLPELEKCYKLNISLVDNKGEMVWTKALPSVYLGFKEVKLVDNYIAAVLYKENGEDIVIYNMDGKIEEIIETEKGFSNIVETEMGFIVVQSKCRNSLLLRRAANKVSAAEGNEALIHIIDNNCCLTGEIKEPKVGEQNAAADIMCMDNHQVYYLYHKIEPKVTSGKGKIEVIDKQKPGKPVEFVITPDEGYVLGKVKVTDAKGKTVVFTSNRFTMPTADVTIEVEFLVANAETKDIAIIGVSIIAILAAAIVFTQYKKLKEN